MAMKKIIPREIVLEIGHGGMPITEVSKLRRPKSIYIGVEKPPRFEGESYDDLARHLKAVEQYQRGVKAIGKSETRMRLRRTRQDFRWPVLQLTGFTCTTY